MGIWALHSAAADRGTLRDAALGQVRDSMVAMISRAVGEAMHWRIVELAYLRASATLDRGGASCRLCWSAAIGDHRPLQAQRRRRDQFADLDRYLLR